MGRGNENGLPNCLYANGKPESRMCNLVDRLDSLGERGKHRQGEGGVRCETHRSAPARFRYAATNPVAKTSRALATKPVQGVNERWKKSKGNGDGRRAGLGLVRGGSRGGAVDGCVGGEHGADHSPAWGTNHDANKGANSARGPTEETGVRAGAGDGANARPRESADYKADQGMLSPRLGPEDVETRATSSRFTETSEPFSFRVSNSSVTVTNFPAWRFMLDSITSIPWPAFRRFRLDHEPCCV